MIRDRLVRARPRLGLQGRLKVPPSPSVSRIGEEVATHLPVEAWWSHAQRLYSTGLHPAVALHIRHHGRPILDRTVGHLVHEPGEAPDTVVTPETLFHLFSATKVITATLILALVDDGLLDLDTPVEAWLPGFALHGKSKIRLRNLLDHTAGISQMPALGGEAEAMLAAGKMDLERLFDLKPSHAPGRDVAYHAMTSWFLLQAVVEQVTGRPLADVLRTRLLEPLGLTRPMYGVPKGEEPLVARHALTGLTPPAFMAKTFEQSVGLPYAEAIRWSNSDAFLATTLPSANAVARPREVTAFLQMLLDEGRAPDGTQLIRPETVRKLHTEASPIQSDSILKLPMRYGLGVMLGSRRWSMYGAGTKGAFGHLGLSNVVAYADPSRDLSVALITTGKPLASPGMVTWYALLTNIASRTPRARAPARVRNMYRR